MGKKKLVNGAAVSLFAREVFLKRTESGLSQKEFGDLIGVSGQQIGAIERTERPPTRQFAGLLDERLGTGDYFQELWSSTKLLGHRRTLPKYIDLEAKAIGIHHFHSQLVPALLQTEEYARAVLRAGFPPKPHHEVEELLAARMGRQKLLDRSEPPLVQFVLDEGMLWRPVGGAGVMGAQLDRILERMEEPFISVQVIPYDQGAYSAMEGGFTVLRLSAVDSALYSENAETGQIYNDPQVVANATGRFNSLMAEALSPSASRKYLLDRRKEVVR
ncbi:helix-turn-helix domain-containing protein [Nocardiopsis protaetiae]|uniref:helix-turn-helix domain-containing protein n=1 Tax=Nocardiopsis protaetiae TaxID=3382270 RepID=UPI00387B09B5